MRGDPTPEAYVRLAGGATASAPVDLAEAYDLSQPGDYTLTFLSPRISHVATYEAALATTVDDLGKVEMPCDPITVTVLPADAAAVAGPPATMALQAVVGWVSPSARIITLATPVDGIDTLALLEAAEIRAADGQTLTLRDLAPGTHIEVLGERGGSDALLVEEVRVRDNGATPAAPPKP
jgi:hypothetical protein